MALEGIFNRWIEQLYDMGVLDVLLPFLLIFTLVYAVLHKSKILGDSNRFDVIVAFVMGMASIVPHIITPGGPADVVIIINSALPHVSLLMIASLMALLLMGVFGKEVNIAGTSLAGWVVLFAIVAVAWIFLASAGILESPAWAQFMFDPEIVSLILAILVFGIIVWFITKEEVPGEKRQTINETVNKMFGGVLK